MTILLTVLLLLAIAAIATLIKMFFALTRKVESLQLALNEFNTPLKTLDDQLKVLYERVDKIDDRIPVIVGWCETLRENQDTLQGDLEKAFYGTKKDIRKVEKQQERAAATEAQKPV
jgi:hypothetical protein